MNAEQNTQNDTKRPARVLWATHEKGDAKRVEIEHEAREQMESRAEDFRRFMDFDCTEREDLRELREEFNEARAAFLAYGMTDSDDKSEAAERLDAAKAEFGPEEQARLAALEKTGEEYDCDSDEGLPSSYGLCLAYQFSAYGGAPGVVFLLSTGGPSEAVVFRLNPGDSEPERVEFVSQGWGTGIGFDVTGEDWADWLWERFSEQAPYLMRDAWEAADVQA